MRALLALDRAAEAAPLRRRAGRSVRRATSRCSWRVRPRAARRGRRGRRARLRSARRRPCAPGRADLLHLQAQVSRAGWATGTAALAASNAALQLDPSLVRVWFELGALEEERQQLDRRRALAYERALDLLPTYSEAALALADLLRRTDTPQAAIAPLVALLEADPYELEALTLLGRALLEDGRTDQALEAFERVLRFDPGARRRALPRTGGTGRAAAAVRRGRARRGSGSCSSTRAARSPRQARSQRALGARPVSTSSPPRRS